MLRLCFAACMLMVLLGGSLHAQNKVRTETIRPPPPAAASPSGKFRSDGHVVRAERQAVSSPAILTDVTQLPVAVSRMRGRILAAARSGELQQLVAVMKANPAMPVFSYAEAQDPIAFWSTTYPDSGGVELLAILTTILETGYVHVDAGTPQEIYLWPYFARTPLDALTPEQMVELFRIVTGGDYKEMLQFGAYSFYRLGIAPDGTWQFFVSGD
jgi:hypothetical protein